MLTLIERRYSGSLLALVSTTASMPRAAAERKMAPTFVGFMTSSSTATRRALLQISSTVGSFGRYMAQSIPRVSLKPVSCVRTSSSAVKTGISPQRAMSCFAWFSTCLVSMRNDIGTHPALSARSMTLGLSAMKMPLSGSRRFNSCTSVRRA